ncbi:ATP-binding cassette domain-containing protein [Streptomyces sp. NRRL S-1521]|uniref:ATP-binding cassette domain-containing protein n=1 Tax=Streptomyces sp. NRRL S-1521 TaxID=1609100 RepID=UPI003B63E8C0
MELTVAPGEFTCVVGPSDCGKPTLLHIAAGLLRPGSGELRIRTNARRPASGVRRPASGVRRPAAMIFQDYGIHDWRSRSRRRSTASCTRRRWGTDSGRPPRPPCPGRAGPRHPAPGFCRAEAPSRWVLENTEGPEPCRFRAFGLQ